MKLSLIQRSCCFGFSLEDGVLGIVVWDSLYALFFITTSINTLIYLAENGRVSDSFTGLATALVLLIRAIIGIRTSRYNFKREILRNYLIVRLFWDGGLLLLNIVMAGLRKMPA